MIRLAVVALGLALAQPAIAQSSVESATPGTPVGTWRGTSTCLVRPSACNDEVVVYRITPMKTADSLQIDARKTLGGKEEEMGILACHFAPPTGQMACAIPRAVWYFRVAKDTLSGELRLRDNTRFRQVRATRAP